MAIDGSLVGKNKYVEHKTRYLFLVGTALLLILIGIALCPSVTRLSKGIGIILTHPSLVDFDSFFWSGEYGAAFVQAGLSLIMTVLFFYISKTKINGVALATCMMVLGFAFYGKNILNMWFPVVGVLLSAKITEKTPREVVVLAFNVACISPIFSVLAFGTPLLGEGSPLAIITGGVVAIIGGILSGIFAAYFTTLHRGLLLYNAGMAAGWAALLVNSGLKAVGLGHDAYPYGDSYITGDNFRITLLILIIFAYFIISGILLGGMKRIGTLVCYKSRGDDHVKMFGFGSCLIHMGIAGLVSVGYILLVGGQLNGCMMTGIFAVIGFSAYGGSMRTHLPVWAGVFIGAFLTGGASGLVAGQGFFGPAMVKVASRGMILSALFTVGVAPIVGRFGVIAGLIVGVVHSMVVVSIPPLHGWMSLYNNGFSLGLITTLLYPVYSNLKKPSREKAKP